MIRRECEIGMESKDRFSVIICERGQLVEREAKNAPARNQIWPNPGPATELAGTGAEN